MKIYTKTGDDGQTGLFGGARVSKFHPRVLAYGDIDELNCALGLARALLDPETGTPGSPGPGVDPDPDGSVRLAALNMLPAVHQRIAEIQGDLFTIGAHFASAKPPKTRLANEAVAKLEGWIDEADNLLPPLKTFILPGGSSAGAQLHVVRTVCRRAERAAWQLRDGIASGAVEAERADPNDVVPAHALVYLNRLSDLAFTWARLVNHLLNTDETPRLPE